jgi:hypothetical protein
MIRFTVTLFFMDQLAKARMLLVSAHPQTASFGPERRFRSFEILDVARYASGFKIAQALL